MFTKTYYAIITSEPLTDKTSSQIFCKTSGEYYTLESLLKGIEENKWVVGNKWKFKYEDTIFKGGNTVEYKTRYKLLKIEKIEYYCKKEKIIREVEKLSPENGFKETEPSDKVLCLDVDYYKKGEGIKTFTVITDGKDYMQKIDNYLRERNLKYPESDEIIVGNIKPFKKEFIV